MITRATHVQLMCRNNDTLRSFHDHGVPDDRLEAMHSQLNSKEVKNYSSEQAIPPENAKSIAIRGEEAAAMLNSSSVNTPIDHAENMDFICENKQAVDSPHTSSGNASSASSTHTDEHFSTPIARMDGSQFIAAPALEPTLSSASSIHSAASETPKIRRSIFSRFIEVLVNPIDLIGHLYGCLCNGIVKLSSGLYNFFKAPFTRTGSRVEIQ